MDATDKRNAFAYPLTVDGLVHVASPQDAIKACERLIRAHSSTFFLGSRLFGEAERQAVSVIYAVCRLGDDAVDGAPTQEVARTRLLIWQEQVSRAYSGVPRSGAFMEVGLHWVLRRYDVPKSAFEDLFLGLESDLAMAQFDTLDELMRYCYRVAGVVGLLIAPIAGYRGGEETLDQAVALGNAMQLTNIVRDVGEDLRLGRCYLPLELLDKYGVSRADLEAGKVTPGYIALLEALIAQADALYAEGWRGVPKLRGAAPAAVGVAALNYQMILRKVQKNGYDNLTRRAYLRRLERAALIPQALYRAYT